VSEREALQETLRAVGAAADETIDLAGAALALAALDHAGTSLDPYREHLGLLAETCALVAGDGGFDACLAALQETLVRRYAYHGDALTYDDPLNADLMSVIDRRQGLPVALGILYIHTARAQGWTIAGLNFPNHFLMRLETQGRRAILDPFSGAMALTPRALSETLKRVLDPEAELAPAHLSAADNRSVLMRLQNNLKTRALAANDVDRAIEIIERTLLFAPGQTSSWRELSALWAHQGNLKNAIGAAEGWLTRAAGIAPRHDAQAWLDELKRRVN
jgi:regulator of sirC expression with transglutaminase-like and TPR domain